MVRALPATRVSRRSAPSSSSRTWRSPSISEVRPGRSLTRRSQSDGWTASLFARKPPAICCLPAPGRPISLADIDIHFGFIIAVIDEFYLFVGEADLFLDQIGLVLGLRHVI